MSSERADGQPSHDTVRIRSVDAEEAGQRLDELTTVLRDAVDSGSSINFLDHATDDDLAAFWRSSVEDLAAGNRVLIVADTGTQYVGTAMVVFASQQNSRHRADVAKMIVHRGYQRRGIASQLLVAIDEVALAHGRTLLMLDTETDSAGEHLYAANGWIRFGEVPGHAHSPDGTLKPTTFFYRVLEPPLTGSAP